MWAAIYTVIITTLSMNPKPIIGTAAWTHKRLSWLRDGGSVDRVVEVGAEAFVKICRRYLNPKFWFSRTCSWLETCKSMSCDLKAEDGNLDIGAKERAETKSRRLAKIFVRIFVAPTSESAQAGRGRGSNPSRSWWLNFALQAEFRFSETISVVSAEFRFSETISVNMDAVKICNSPFGGLGLFSQREFLPGQVVLMESPFLIVPTEWENMTAALSDSSSSSKKILEGEKFRKNLESQVIEPHSRG
jgi:hypothetical protein